MVLKAVGRGEKTRIKRPWLSSVSPPLPHDWPYELSEGKASAMS